MHELKIYSAVICNGTEEWWKIFSGNDLSFQNRHDEFGKFCPEHLKVSKRYTSMGCFSSKVYNVSS